MKSIVFILLLSALAVAQPAGRNSIAAPVTNVGQEIAVGWMIVPGQMILLDFYGSFSNEQDHDEIGNEDVWGAIKRRWQANLLPEYRLYLFPERKVSPYYGFYGRIGYAGDVLDYEDQEDNETSRVQAGVGFTMGAEFFVSRFFSLSAHARFVEYRYEFTEEDLANVEGVTITHAHVVDFDINPAIYVRFYF